MTGVHAMMVVGGIRVRLSGTYTVTNITTSPSISLASFSVKNNGTLEGSGNTANDAAGSWIIPPSAAGAGYEVEFHKNSGDAFGGVVADTYLALNATRTVSLQTDGLGPQSLSCAVRIRIRNAATLAVLAETVLTLSSAEL